MSSTATARGPVSCALAAPDHWSPTDRGRSPATRWRSWRTGAPSSSNPAPRSTPGWWSARTRAPRTWTSTCPGNASSPTCVPPPARNSNGWPARGSSGWRRHWNSVPPTSASRSRRMWCGCARWYWTPPSALASGPVIGLGLSRGLLPHPGRCPGDRTAAACRLVRTPGGARRVVTARMAGAAIVGCAPQPPPLGAPRITPPSASPPLVREVVLGVDRLIGGFNPHTLADLTPISEAVAGLLLPSAFHQTPTGQWILDRTLLTSAEVTATTPFTVTYRIRRNAQWSDITPIAAEDFGYLAGQMRTQPGVVDSAGYQLIDQVISRDGGKTAEVVFTRPYAGWRTLFRHLLPAHLLKDAPGGWSKALDAGLPVSGGPFAMTSVDRSRGEIVLERNDRYWDTPTQVGRIRLRQGSEAALVEALRTGGVQGALFGRPNAITESLLRAADLGVSPTVVPQPVLVSVLLRPASRVLSDQRMRTAV